MRYEASHKDNDRNVGIKLSPSVVRGRRYPVEEVPR